jgi:hypothetical protein
VRITVIACQVCGEVFCKGDKRPSECAIHHRDVEVDCAWDKLDDDDAPSNTNRSNDNDPLRVLADHCAYCSEASEQQLLELFQAEVRGNAILGERIVEEWFKAQIRTRKKVAGVD